MSSNDLKKHNINNLKMRKESDLRGLLDNRLLQFAYRTSVGIVRTVYLMAFVGAVVFVILIVIGLALS